MDLEKYQSYAKAVLNGDILAGKWVKLAATRYLQWFERDDFYFDTKTVDSVINFISKLKVNSTTHFIVQPWQRWIIYSIYGFRRKDNNKRVTRNVFISMARKNGKSSFVGAICVYELLFGVENGYISLLANTRKQSMVSFDYIMTYLRFLDPKRRLFKTLRETIRFDKKNSKLDVLSGDANKGLDGLSISCGVLDEVHEYKDDRLVSVCASAQGAREEPLLIEITTSGFNLFGYLADREATAKEILSGLKEDDTLFSAIYQLDEGDNYEDETVWIKANPNLNVSIFKDYLIDQVRKAKNQPSLEVGVKTKHFNLWCSASDVWINDNFILEASKKIDFNFFKDRYIYIGIDLSSVSDLTAVSFMTYDSEDGTYYFKNLYYLPETALYESVNAEMYKQWKREGYLITTNSNVVDYDYILRDVLKYSKETYLEKIGYDQWNSQYFATNATLAGLPLEPVSQSIGNYSIATKEYHRLIRMGKIVIDNNPITRWCHNNVVIKQDWNENEKPIKASKEQKIDGVIAQLTALKCYLDTPQYQNEILTIK